LKSVFWNESSAIRAADAGDATVSSSNFGCGQILGKFGQI